jgi:hypothetical protein
MKVYVVFTACDDESGWTDFEFETVCSSVENAIDYILLTYWGINITEPVHPSMNENNNWIYIGKRDDCKQSSPSSLGGFIIEEMTMN